MPDIPMQRGNKVGSLNTADTLLHLSPSRLKWQPDVKVYVCFELLNAKH